MRIYNQFKLFSAFILLVSNCYTVDLFGQNMNHNIDKDIMSLFEKTDIAGMTISMLNSDRILYQNGFGYADIERKTKYTTDKIQNIGSISKTFIGVSIMKLVDQGKLNLDDPINSYLPFKVLNPKYPENPITIRHLATHTSGIKDHMPAYELKSYFIDSIQDKTQIVLKGHTIQNRMFLKKIITNQRLTLQEYLKNTLTEDGIWYNKKIFFNTVPGKIYNYSNIGATLAAYIVEVVSGKSFSKFTKDEIFDPLKMSSTGWFYKDIDLDNFVTRYIGKKRIILPKYDISTYPDGALKTTIKDLSIFLQEMLKGHLGKSNFLTKISFVELFKNQLSLENEDRNGIFWEIFGSTGIGDIGHGGSDPGVFTLMYFSPKTNIGKILISNTSDIENQIIPIWEKFIKMEKFFIPKNTTKSQN